MNPPEKVAALSALKHGIEKQIEVEKAAAMALAESVGVKTFKTPFGPVTVAGREAGTAVIPDETLLMEWVKVHQPHNIETITRVRPSAVNAILTDLVAVGGDVVNRRTGEVVDFATVKDVPAGDPYITYPGSKESKLWKDHATELVAGQAELLSDALRQIEAGQ